MKEKEIVLGWDEIGDYKGKIQVCEHISIDNARFGNMKEDSPEVTTDLNIHCEVCKKTYKFRILIP